MFKILLIAIALLWNRGRKGNYSYMTVIILVFMFSFPPPFIHNDFAISWLYDELDNQWRQWLPSSVSNTVRRGAFYSVLVRPGFRIISLNMNYCNNKNWYVWRRTLCVTIKCDSVFAFFVLTFSLGVHNCQQMPQSPKPGLIIEFNICYWINPTVNMFNFQKMTIVISQLIFINLKTGEGLYM
jgi:hypothetical protein